jgi:hypothetical protein
VKPYYDVEKRRRDLKKVISVTPIYLVPKAFVPLLFLDGVVKIPEAFAIRWWMDVLKFKRRKKKNPWKC